MPLDEMTRRNLELVESLRGGGSEEERCSRFSIERSRRWERVCCVSGCSLRSLIEQSIERDSMPSSCSLRVIQSREKRCATRWTAFATSRRLGEQGSIRARHAARASCARRFGDARCRQSHAALEKSQDP